MKKKYILLILALIIFINIYTCNSPITNFQVGFSPYHTNPYVRLTWEWSWSGASIWIYRDNVLIFSNLIHLSSHYTFFQDIVTLGTSYEFRIEKRDIMALEEDPCCYATTTFLAIAPPHPLISPPFNSTNQSLRPTFSWSDIPTGATHYHVYKFIGNTGSPWSPYNSANPNENRVTPESGITSFSWAPSVDLQPNTTYRWQVVGSNALGMGTASATWIFTTQTIVSPPGQPTATAPIDNATNQPLRPTMSWDSVTGATHYHVYKYIGTTGNPYSPGNLSSNRVTPEGGIPTASWTPSFELQNNTTYRWQVVASNAMGMSSGSIARNFTTIADYEGTPGLSFAQIPGQNAYSVSRGTANASHIIIPSTNPSTTTGWPVTRIGGFIDFTTMTGITIPNSITRIDTQAFWGCTGLTSITIPNNVTYIGMNSFVGCSSLTSINVEPSNIVFRSEGNSVIRRENNELIIGIKTTVIPDNVTSIGNGAFSGQTGLTSITIPNSVVSIGSGAFVGCTGLTSINVSSGNTIFRSEGNSVIRIDNNELIIGIKTTIIPNSVTRIGHSAFFGCTGLANINIPSSVTRIGNDAFGNCTSLTSIVIPNSVTSVGSVVFWGCTYLTIYVEAASKPSGWHENWNRLDLGGALVPVVWGFLTNPPQNLTASAGNQLVNLSWDAPATRSTGTLTGYKLFRGTTATNLSQVGGTLPLTPRTFLDTGLTNGNTYYYQIVAVYSNPDRDSERVPTPPVTATPILYVPGQVTLTSPAPDANNQPLRPTLSWNVATGATHYHVYKFIGSTGNPYVLSDPALNRVSQEGGITTTSWTPSADLLPNTTYRWQVVASNASGMGEGSIARNFTTQIAVPILPPQNLTHSVEGNNVTLNWQAPSSEADNWFTHSSDVLGTSGLAWAPATATYTGIIAQRFTPAHLVAMGVAGGMLTHVRYGQGASVGVGSVGASTYQVRIFRGTEWLTPVFSGPALLSDAGAVGQSGALRTVELSTPVAIPTNEDLYIALAINRAANTFPFMSAQTTAQHPAIADFTGIVHGTLFGQGNVWVNVTLEGGVGINWMIGGRALTSSGSPVTIGYQAESSSSFTIIENIGVIETQTNTSFIESTSISAAIIRERNSLHSDTTIRSTQTLLGYNIRRNGVLLNTSGPITALTFTNNNVSAGQYIYSVVAVYSTGESEAVPSPQITLVNPAISVSPSPHGFGNVNVDQSSASQTFTITNISGHSLTVSQVGLTGADANQFDLTASGFPWAIPAGANRTFSVVFNPTSIGGKSANISITHNANGSPTNISLTGTGIANVPLPVTILNSPPNVATNQSVSPTLTWTLPENTPARAGIYVYIGTTNPPFNPANPTNNRVATLDANATIWNVSPALAHGIQYFWQIVPYNDAGLAIGGAVWRFTTQIATPDPVVLLTPIDTATNVSVTPTFTWGTGSQSVISEERSGLISEVGDLLNDEWSGASPEATDGGRNRCQNPPYPPLQRLHLTR